jgi:CheY-like chemotaxis protein
MPDRGRVLHVDDDPTARMVFAHWLARNGYEHAIASGPAEAEGLLAQGSFDVVLSDIHMPGNIRLEWIEQVLARPGAPAVLLLTGSPAFESACRAANLAVAGYLLKPVEFAVLDQTLQRLVRARRHDASVLSLTRDIVHLLKESPRPDVRPDGAHARKLALLTQALETRLEEPAGDESWSAAIADAIAVIEQTRHSFRSRELGQLRARLQRVLMRESAIANPAEPLFA